MKEGQKLWTREELILALNLYYKTPFGKMHSSNPDIIHLANLIGRSASSVAFKLGNLASLDPSLKARGIKGASNSSKLDQLMWDEFYDNLDALSFESEILLAKKENSSVEDLLDFNEDILLDGRTRESLVKLRVNQSFFRKSILAAYNNTCCITGIQIPQLIISGHIVPWSQDEKNRLNPRNGIAINSLHDKAFENGLITITPDYRIRVSSILMNKKDDIITSYFKSYDGEKMILPTKFLPDPEFLKIHNQRFKE